MRGSALIVTLTLFYYPSGTLAQGFAGLGGQAQGYAQVSPETELAFPADHGPHPDFRIEWWYVTANLTDQAAAPLGLQWTVFRIATRPDGPDRGWEARQLWMAHAAVTTPDRHLAAERFARGGIGQGGARTSPVRVYVDDWRLEGATMDRIRIAARDMDFSYDLALSAAGPLILHGADGFSVKSPSGQASHYYSHPHYRAEGTVTIDGQDRQVTGQAWLDREWSSQPLAPDQQGWDWFSLRLESGASLMIFGLRDSRGGRHVTGTWIAPDGTTRTIPEGSAEMMPLETHQVAGRDIPIRWRLRLPTEGLDITVTALNQNAFSDLTFPYWEGPVTVAGSHRGNGYMELTGYPADG